MKAVIAVNGHQYIVAKGDEIIVSRLKTDAKSYKFEPLLMFDEASIKVGTPTIAGAQVTAEVLAETLGDKTISIRYEAKKRVKKIRGHRQKQTVLTIKNLSTK